MFFTNPYKLVYHFLIAKITVHLLPSSAPKSIQGSCLFLRIRYFLDNFEKKTTFHKRILLEPDSLDLYPGFISLMCTM